MRRLALLTAALVLALSACTGDTGSSGKGQSGSNKYPPPPCHPGCFPAGTEVATPDGPRPIENLHLGERVLLVGPDGAAAAGQVNGVYQTANRLVEVQTDSGTLRTTATQPLCLRDGGFRPAGELAEGDVVWRWQDGERRPARVRAVVATGAEVAVYNVVVGESAVFVAGGFLARGKPPAPAE